MGLTVLVSPLSPRPFLYLHLHTSDVTYAEIRIPCYSDEDAGVYFLLLIGLVARREQYFTCHIIVAE